MNPNDAVWRRLRLPLLAALYGAVAGVVANVTLQAMTWCQDLLWRGADPWWRIALTIGAGGLVLGLLRRVAEPLTMAALLQADPEDRGRRHRIILVTAASAVVAVAFGGAVGPEAGLVAVVAEIWVLVGHRLTRDVAEARVLERSATAASLSGLYASPPGAAALDDDEIGPGKVLPVLAGVAGFFAFLLCSRLVFDAEGVQAVALPGGEVTWHVAVAGLAGSLLGLIFRWLHHGAEAWAQRAPRPWMVLAAGTTAFAALAAAVPLVRFSGHHEVAELAAPIAASDTGWLVMVALAKVVALSLCLVAGWRGGEFFPLAFAGAAVGAASALAVGGDPGPAMAAAMGAAVVAGWGKPVAAFLVLALLVTGVPSLAVVAGVGIGWLVMALVTPDRETGRGGGAGQDEGPLTPA